MTRLKAARATYFSPQAMVQAVFDRGLLRTKIVIPVGHAGPERGALRPLKRQ